MATGRPGLPTGFMWRGQHFAIVRVLEDWKQSEASGHAAGQRYYRKHFYRLLTQSGEVLTLYAVRHVKPGESPRRRWWLYSIERPSPKVPANR